MNLREVVALRQQQRVLNRKRGESEDFFRKQPWRTYRSTASDYERRVGLPPQMLERAVEEFRANDIEPLGLDFGADTTALASLDIGGVAVGLRDVRPDVQQNLDVSANRHMLIGDILDTKTWNNIHRKIDELHLASGFPIVMSAAEGGIEYITQDPVIHASILQRMWGVTSFDNGLLAIQTRIVSGKRIYELSGMQKLRDSGWIYILRREYGIFAAFTDNGLFIRKDPNAPEDLPFPHIDGSRFSFP